MTGERKNSVSDARAEGPEVESAVISIHASPEQQQGKDGKDHGVDEKLSVGDHSFVSSLRRGMENRDCESLDVLTA
jgi:hypothetical protein